MNMQIKLSYAGDIPCKKNAQKISRYGGIYKDPKVRQFEKDIALSLSNYKKYKIIGDFSISGTIAIADRKDLDGALASILDALQYAGIVENDRNLRQIKDLIKLRVVKKTGQKEYFSIVVDNYLT